MVSHRPFALLAAVAAVALTGCPSDQPANPTTLWLATDVVETQVKLIDHEPPPF